MKRILTNICFLILFFLIFRPLPLFRDVIQTIWAGDITWNATAHRYDLALDSDTQVVIGSSGTWSANKLSGSPEFFWKKWGKASFQWRIPVVRSSWTFSAADKAIYVSSGPTTYKIYKATDGLAFDIIFNSPPKSSTITITVENYDEFEWWTQSMSSYVAKGGANRDERVMGSVAVYHKILRDNQYTTGKAGHIYRPYFTDNKGNVVWAAALRPYATSGKAGAIDIVFPEAKLAAASYPVTVDPELGYHAMGSNLYMLWCDQSAGESMVMTISSAVPAGKTIAINNIFMGLYANSANQKVRMALYDTTKGNPSTRCAVDASSVAVSNAGYTWVQNNADYNYTWTGSSVIAAASSIPCTAGNVYIAYDDNGAAMNLLFFGSNEASGGLPNTWTNFASPWNGKRPSVYVTYTEVTPPVVPVSVDSEVGGYILGEEN